MVKYSDGLDAVATALAHPGRRQIVSRLGTGPATSSELAAEVGIGLPALHKHLALLSTAGVIDSHKTGRVVTHRLRGESLQRFDSWLATRTSFWTHQLATLGDSFGTTVPDAAPDTALHTEEIR